MMGDILRAEDMTPDQLAAYADYCRDCAADPCGEWLDFDAYFAEWCEARDWEAAECLRIELLEDARLYRQVEAERTCQPMLPYDGETPF